MATKAEQLQSPYMSCHGQPVLKKIIKENNYVCPECNEHHKLEPHQYYDNIFFGMVAENISIRLLFGL